MANGICEQRLQRHRVGHNGGESEVKRGPNTLAEAVSATDAGNATEPPRTISTPLGKLQVRLRTAIKHKTKEPMRRQAMGRDALETMATTHGAHCLERAQCGSHMSKKPRSSQGAQGSPGQPEPTLGRHKTAAMAHSRGPPSQTRLHSMVGRLLLSQIQCVCVCRAQHPPKKHPPHKRG